MTSVCEYGVLESASREDINEISSSWGGFCSVIEAMLVDTNGSDILFGSDLVVRVNALCKHGLSALAQDHFFVTLQSPTMEEVNEISSSWVGFCSVTEAMLVDINGSDLLFGSDLVVRVNSLCRYGVSALAQDHFFISLQENFEEKGAAKFWQHFDGYINIAARQNSSDPIEKDRVQLVLCKALEEISLLIHYQEKCLSMLTNAVLASTNCTPAKIQKKDAEKNYLLSKYQLMVSSVLMATLPRHFPEILHWYFKGKLEELNTIIGGDSEDDNEVQDSDDMDIDGSSQRKRLRKIVGNIGMVVRDLRSLGFTSMAEDAYASAILLVLKAKVDNLAGDDYRTSVLESIKGWIKTVPLQFLHALLDYLGDSINYDSTPSSCLKSPLATCPSSFDIGIENPTEGLVRWQLRLEYFAYETLQDLRIAKLFEIIVDYPDSSPAIEDLKQCLEYTGQHSKLVDSFISALRYRLLTAGASTNDILHQYVSTIKALKTIDPAGVFLEAVGEPVREYLKGRKDTIKCVVTMLTDGSGASLGGAGNPGDSLLEELNRDEETQEDNGVDDDLNTDDKQAWVNAQNWKPDPVEADPMKGSRSRRKVDILGMIVSLIGSKDQLVNEYRVMLAEKLLNKSDYDIDTEIRTLELLKIHFGEGSMQKCEIMLNDLIDSKRTNTNIKATINQLSQPDEVLAENELSLDILTATILSTNFWPPIQDEALKIPESVEQLLNDYARRFTEIKTPRKLLWKKNLGTVKLELQFEDKAQQFTVTPMHASIIMQFQEQTSWTSKNLAAAIGVPVDVLTRRINFWISKGIISESSGADTNDHIFNLVDGTMDSSKSGANNRGFEELLAGDDDGETSVASVEDQLRKEMTVYEKFIIGMLMNFGSMALDRIQNTLKMFCLADPAYDKSLQQLQSFLAGLVAEHKLELRDGMYFLKK